MPTFIREPEVRIAINRSIGLLRKTYRSNPQNSNYGWYHYLDDPNAGVTASAVALFCFYLTEETFELTDQVLKFLLSKQISSQDDSLDGGWSIRTTFDFPIIESTAWVVRSLALNHAFFDQEAPSIERGYRWILRHQNLDHGWGSIHNQPSRIFLTSLAILALSSVNKYSTEISLGADYLLKHRRSDIPAWGPIPGAEPTVLHTCFALLALSEVPNKLTPTILKISLDWVEEKMNPQSLTETLSQAEEYDIPYELEGKERIFQNNLPHFALPIAVYTLLKLSDRITSDKVNMGISTIIRSQTEDGYWQIPRNPTRPSIWGVWPFLAALNQVIKVPLASEASNLTISVIGDAVILQPSDKEQSLLSIIIKSLFRSISIYLKKKFGWLILVLFIVIGLFLVLIGVINWQEYFLSLLLPIILLVLQLIIEKR